MSGWGASFAAGLLLLSLCALIHAYLLYPASLWLWRRLAPRRATIPPEPAVWPTVALVVSAYNEEEGIEEKIRNFQALTYPPERLSLLLGDDASSDATLSRARRAIGEDARISLFAFSERRGKARVVNDLLARAEADILVFTDATSRHAPDSVARLVRWLADPSVGVAGARLIYEKPAGQAERSETGEGLYWRLETFLRQAESDLGSAMQPSGACYAVRRADAAPLPPNTVCDDFHLPLSVARKGTRIVIDDAARVSETLAVDQGAEFRRRVRIGTGNFQILFRFWPLLWPGYGRLWYMYLSHKVLRWLGPLWLLLAFFASAALWHSPLGRACFGVQLLGYAAVGLAWRVPALRAKSRLLNLGFYFCSINAALGLGALRFVVTRPTGRWEKA